MAQLITKEQAGDNLIKRLASYGVELDLESRLATQNRSRLRSLGKYGKAREQHGISNTSDTVLGEIRRVIQTYYREYTGKNVNVKRIKFEGELPGSRLYATTKHSGGTAQVPTDDEPTEKADKPASAKADSMFGQMFEMMKKMVAAEKGGDVADDSGDEPEVDF